MINSRHGRTAGWEETTGNWGRTRFESNGHGVYDGADGRPDFVQEFDLVRVRITWDGFQEDNTVKRKVLQGLQVAPCGRDDSLLAAE